MWEKLGGILGRKAEQTAAKTVREEALDQAPKEENSLLETAGDYLDRPASVVRQGIKSSMEEDGDVLADMYAQAQRPSSQAPTGADIAESAREKFDIQDPLALGAIATASDLADPMMLIPGGQANKAMKAVQTSQKFPKLKKIFTLGNQKIYANSTADALQQMNKLRSDGVVPKASQLVDTGKNVADEFEQLRKAMQKLNK